MKNDLKAYLVDDDSVEEVTVTAVSYVGTKEGLTGNQVKFYAEASLEVDMDRRGVKGAFLKREDAEMALVEHLKKRIEVSESWLEKEKSTLTTLLSKLGK